MASHEKPDKLPANKQLRGDKLIEHLVRWVVYLKDSANEEGREYILNQSELEDLSGVSRRSIGKNLDKVLEQVTTEIKAKVRNNSATVNALQNRVKDILQENAELKDKLNTMRVHHLRLYEALSENPYSYEATQLLKSIHVEFAESTGECPICGSEITGSLDKSSNVVHLNRKK